LICGISPRRGLRSLLLLGVVLTATLVLATGALATTPGAVVDQSSSGTADSQSLVSDVHDQGVAQTFVAGQTGELTDVDLGIARDSFYSGTGTGSVRVSIVGTATDGSPDTSTELAGADIAETAIQVGSPAALQVTFSAPATLVAGTVYAIYIYEVSSQHVHILVAAIASNGYASGDRYYTFGNGSVSAAGGALSFKTYVIPTAAEVAEALASAPSRMAYCTVEGDTWQDGTLIAPGTFVDLSGGQPLVDPHYIGATPAMYVEGKGLTCDPPPTGFELHGYADEPGLPTDAYGFYK
jgi:hypothetical protein